MSVPSKVMSVPVTPASKREGDLVAGLDVVVLEGFGVGHVAHEGERVLPLDGAQSTTQAVETTAEDDAVVVVLAGVGIPGHARNQIGPPPPVLSHQGLGEANAKIADAVAGIAVVAAGDASDFGCDRLVHHVVGKRELDLRIERQAHPQRRAGLEFVALGFEVANEEPVDHRRKFALAARVAKRRLDLGLPERQQQNAFLGQRPLERTVDRILIDIELPGRRRWRGRHLVRGR
jgi:hypothetical protein